MTSESGANGAAEKWELWNLRALLPRADRQDLAVLKAKRQRIEGFESRVFNDLMAGSVEPFAPGRRFLADNPAVASGLIVTMHMGPYQFLIEPFLHAGIRPAVLLNEQAHSLLRARAERLQELLRLAGQLEWLPITSRTFVRRMIGVLRDGRPLVVFLDGNSGLGGSKQTRNQGMIYNLPGRDIRVRTGLGRLIHRLDCPVHGMVVRWDDKGGITWHAELGRTWDVGDGPEAITRGLYDWGFGHVLAAPEQWGYWDMLRRSYACFSAHSFATGRMPPSLRKDFQRAFDICLKRSPGTVRVELTKEVEIWPGDVLANLSDDCFHAAEGLRGEELLAFQGGRSCLADLCRHYGEDWVRFHVQRLCLLDVAQLRGV